MRVGPVRAAVLSAATLMACAVSAQAGVIAFSALIAPHGARLLLGGRLRRFELRYGVRAHRWTLWRFLDREAPAGRCEFSVHPHM